MSCKSRLGGEFENPLEVYDKPIEEERMFGR